MTKKAEEKVFSVRLKQWLVDEIEVEAELMERNRNQQISYLLKKGIEVVKSERVVISETKKETLYQPQKQTEENVG